MKTHGGVKEVLHTFSHNIAVELVEHIASYDGVPAFKSPPWNHLLWDRHCVICFQFIQADFMTRPFPLTSFPDDYLLGLCCSGNLHSIRLSQNVRQQIQPTPRNSPEERRRWLHRGL